MVIASDCNECGGKGTVGCDGECVNCEPMAPGVCGTRSRPFVTEIRLAKKSDLKSVYAIYKHRANQVVAPSCAYTEDSFEAYVDGSTAHLYVADIGGMVFGFALVYDMLDWGFVEVVAVDESCRRQGIGSKLLNYVVDHKKPQWMVVEACYNTDDVAAKALLESCGFGASRQSTEWVYSDRSVCKPSYPPRYSFTEREIVEAIRSATLLGEYGSRSQVPQEDAEAIARAMMDFARLRNG